MDFFGLAAIFSIYLKISIYYINLMYYNRFLNGGKEMKLKMNITFIMMMMIFLVWSTPALSGMQSGTFQDMKYDRLMNTAFQKGYIRVIVHLDVPNIEELTGESRKFKTGIKDDVYIQRAYDADLALEEAISISRYRVLHRLNGSSYRVNRTYSTLPCIALTVSPETLDRLMNIGEVLNIFEDKATPLPPTEESAIEDVSQPELTRSVEIVGADEAWGQGYTGAGWFVAILDSGILASHEMFQGKTIVEQCYSLGDDWFDLEHGGCPNGGIEMSGPGSAAPHASRFGHGTHVSGIAAGNNHIDRFGVARDADIISVQIFTYFPEEDDVLSWYSDQIKGLEYIYSIRNMYNIASVNMSLGDLGEIGTYCDDSDFRTSAITSLKAAGIATIIASGNESYCNGINSPACISTAVAVTSSDKQDNASYFGNWHDVLVDLVAPGSNITSAFSTGDTDYRIVSGTSMATPHVTGAWAIIKQFDSNIGIDDIKTLLQETGHMISPTMICPTAQAKPRFNIGDAIFTLLGLAPPVDLTATQNTNKAFLRTEFLNSINWNSNPLNENKNVTYYRVYIVQGSQLNLLTQLNNSTFEYWHRNVQEGEIVTYAITAVDNQGLESIPAYVDLEIDTH
jgi:subtilisin family serine protease